MIKTPAFIVNYNRLGLPRAMADYLADVPELEVVIVDNASDYPPLLDYYQKCPHKVELMGANYGASVVWHDLTHERLRDKYDLTKRRYIVTDPDLDLSGIPKDFMHLLHLGLDRYDWAWKAGFSLEINDLPGGPIRNEILKWESNYWTTRLDAHFWRASIDSTFCLCRSYVHDFPAVRTDRPYTARHIPWYYTPDNLPDDERYYLKTAGPWSTFARNWSAVYD